MTLIDANIMVVEATVHKERSTMESNITSLPSNPISMETLMGILIQEASSVPDLDYAALVKIRQAGYIDSSQLLKVLVDQGFKRFVVTERSLEKMYELRQVQQHRRRGSSCLGTIIEFENDPRNITRAFAGFTTYQWKSGWSIKELKRLRKMADKDIQKAPAVKTALATDTKLPRLRGLSDKEKHEVMMEWEKYRSWNRKTDWLHAQQQFMKVLGKRLGYTVRPDAEIAHRVQKELRNGTLSTHTTVTELADIVNFQWRWIRENPLGVRKVFSLGYSPGNIDSVIKRYFGVPWHTFKKRFSQLSLPAPEEKDDKQEAVPPAPEVQKPVHTPVPTGNTQHKRIGKLLSLNIELVDGKRIATAKIELSSSMVDAHLSVLSICDEVF